MMRFAVSLFMVIVTFACSDRQSPVSSESAGTSPGTVSPRPAAGNPVNFEEMAANYAQSVSQDEAGQGPVTGASSHECTYDVPIGTTTFTYTFGTGDCNGHAAAFGTGGGQYRAIRSGGTWPTQFGSLNFVSLAGFQSRPFSFAGNDPISIDICVWKGVVNAQAACGGNTDGAVIRRITLRRPPLSGVTISGRTSVIAGSRNTYTATTVDGINPAFNWNRDPRNGSGAWDNYSPTRTVHWIADTDLETVGITVEAEEGSIFVYDTLFVTVNHPTHVVTVAGPTSRARQQEGTWTATLDPAPEAGTTARWQWRWFIGGRGGRVIPGCATATCTWAPQGFYRGQSRLSDDDGNEVVRIIPIATVDGVRYKPEGDARHDVTITNTPPTMVARGGVRQSFWIDTGYPHTCQDVGGTWNAGSKTCSEASRYSGVTLTTDVHDVDDPPYVNGAARQSYLRDVGSYSWSDISVDLDPYDEALMGGGMDLRHIPWSANFTPPPQAYEGHVFTITPTVTDPDGGSASAEFTVEVVGKDPPPPPSNFDVELTPNKTDVRLGRGSVTITSAVSGNYAEPLRYEWTSTLTHDHNGRPTTRRPYPAGWIRNGDRPTAQFSPYRPGTAEIEVTVTDANGVEATGSVSINVSFQ